MSESDSDGRSRCTRTLADLEASVRVPVDEQVSTRSEPPPPAPLAPEELDRHLLLGVTGAGRLRLH